MLLTGLSAAARRRAGLASAAAGLTVLVACQPAPAPIVVTPPPAEPAPAAATPAPTASSNDLNAVSAPRTAAAPAQPQGRPQYQMDAQHTGRSPYAGPRAPVRVRGFNAADVPTTDPGDPRPEIQSSAAIAPDGTIYLGTFPGNLLALRDPGAGGELELMWRFHPAGASSFHTTPAIGADGTVYVGFSTGGATPEARGTFYALGAPAAGAQEPTVRWMVDLGPGRQTASPTLGPDGTIYVTSGAGRLLALSPEGQTMWSIATGPTIKAAPALATDGTVYVSSMNGQLYAVEPPAAPGAEVRIRWTFSFGEFPGQTPPVVATVPPPGADGVGSGVSPTVGPDGTIYVGANNSNFYAITPDGQLKWMFEAEREVAGIWSSAALNPDAKTLYFAANKGGIYALSTETGQLAWQYPIFGSIYNSLTIDRNGILYTGSTAGHLIAIDSASQQRVFDWTDGAPVWTAPALRPDGTVLIGDTKGVVSLIGNQL